MSDSVRTLLILIPGLPLLSAVVTALLGRRVLRHWSHLPTILALGASCAMSLMLLLEVRQPAPDDSTSGSVRFAQVEPLWTWIDVKDAFELNGQSRDFTVEVALRADSLTSVMLVMVTFISTLVAIYAAGYMRGDDGYGRFFAYISLFVFSMTMLVSVSNFVLLYVFWEAVGACSYLLIGFWFQKPSAAAAGKKAFLVNRIGDFGFAIALFLIWTTYGSLDFHGPDGIFGDKLLSGEAAYVGGGVGLAICLLLMVGACGKSAQFPLHVWLPDAMEGPTPVSALIHAATMVTAGVYMVTRCSPLFFASAADPYVVGYGLDAVAISASMVVAGIGAFTALLAGLIALTQNDLKRVLAYSTVSQLGYMFLSLGTGSLIGITAGMFHLFTHAFFKALLFLGSGSVMHSMGHVIDMRRFGGLRKIMPYTHWTFLVGCLALAGVFPLAGFFSKDAILIEVFVQGHSHSPTAAYYQVLYCVGIVAALLTAFYTFRAFFMTFYGPLRVPAEAGDHAHESPMSMVAPLCILSVFAATVGLLLSSSFGQFLVQTPSLAYVAGQEAAHATGSHHDHHHAHQLVATTSTLVALLGIGLAAFLHLGNRSQAQWLATRWWSAWFYRLSYGKFFFDEIYIVLIVWPLRLVAGFSYLIDRYLIDGIVNLCGAIPPMIGSRLRSTQRGIVQYYAFASIFVLMFFLVAALYFNDFVN
jgi:NADH-quinone oxidoreductase subunit L